MTSPRRAKELGEITKEEFTAYERIRQSGLVNMFSPQVEDLTDIDRATRLGIITHYSELNKKWPDVRQAKLWY